LVSTVTEYNLLSIVRLARQKGGRHAAIATLWRPAAKRERASLNTALNPTEGMWSSLKAVELANLTAPTLAEVIGQAHKGIERVRQTPHLACSFLRHTGLSVS